MIVQARAAQAASTVRNDKSNIDPISSVSAASAYPISGIIDGNNIYSRTYFMNCPGCGRGLVILPPALDWPTTVGDASAPMEVLTAVSRCDKCGQKSSIAVLILHESLLTVADVARFTKTSERTVRTWIDDGRLPVLQAAAKGAIRIRPDDLRQLMAEETRRTDDKGTRAVDEAPRAEGGGAA